VLLLGIDDFGHGVFELERLVGWWFPLAVVVEEETLHDTVGSQVPDGEHSRVDELEHDENEQHDALGRFGEALAA